MNKEEEELLKSIEAEEWVSDSKSDFGKYRDLASEQLKKNKQISLRISENDLRGLQRKAFEEGMPYQTLIGSILHKYLSGKLVEVK